MKKKNLAICTPSGNAYSETFIQAHKDVPNANIFYYYNGTIPRTLENIGNLYPDSFFSKIHFYIIRFLFYKNFSLQEITLIRSFQKNKINVVLAEYGTTGVQLLKVCKYLNLSLIVHFHGYDASIKKVLEDNIILYREMFGYAKYIIVVSNIMKNKILELGCPEEKILLNIYGPNDDFLKINPNYSGKYFISIGRFVDKKAPYYLILTMRKVVESHPNTKLFIGGNGALYNTCKNLIQYYNLKDNIILLDIIKPQEYQEYLKNAIAYVQHSITAENGDMEGTPVSIIEASAAGLPVISTLHAGIPDVIIHEKTGFLVEEHDVENMAGYIIHLIENPSLAKAMGALGKKNIQENFSITKHLNILSELIQSCN
jgi:colanic acid/amylovoran biosynthesis glycosyltransferase